jgi:hypothetical protein
MIKVDNNFAIKAKQNLQCLFRLRLALWWLFKNDYLFSILVVSFS